MVLVCSTLMTNNVEHLFMCLFAVHLSSFGGVPRGICPVLTELFVPMSLTFEISFYFLDMSPLSGTHFAKIFLPVCGLCFYSLNNAF